MTAKKCTIIGIQPTNNDAYKRYHAITQISEGRGFGQASLQFTDRANFEIGDEVNVVYTYKLDKNKNSFGVWEVLRI